MTNLLLFILSCYGMTFILVYGSIFNSIRPKQESGFLGKLFNCPLCTGFHVGYIIFSLFWLGGIKLFPHFIIGNFIFACISSGTSYLLSVVVDDFGIKINGGDKNEYDN